MGSRKPAGRKKGPKTTQILRGDHLTLRRRADAPRNRRVAIRRWMGACLVIVAKALGQNSLHDPHVATV